MEDSTNKIIEEAAVLPGVLEDENIPLIPQELMEIGWLCQQSPDKGRCYYFNVNTNECRWDLPDDSQPVGHNSPPPPPLVLDITTPELESAIINIMKSQPPLPPVPADTRNEIQPLKPPKDFGCIKA